jgi:hypothetical protein
MLDPYLSTLTCVSVFRIRLVPPYTFLVFIILKKGYDASLITLCSVMSTCLKQSSPFKILSLSVLSVVQLLFSILYNFSNQYYVSEKRKDIWSLVSF